MVVSDELLHKYKLSIGDFNANMLMDEYYRNYLSLAIAHLKEDDISVERLESELGYSCIILYAKALMNGEDVATNSTITLLKHNLAIYTKGDRYEDN